MQQLTIFIRRRLFILLLIFVLLMAILISRMFFVQIIRGPKLTKGAYELWNREIPFSQKRGRILDRNGYPLVENISAPSVIAIPIQITDKKATAAALAHVLNAPVEAIERQFKKRQLLVRIIPFGRKINEKQAQDIMALRLPGISLTDDTKRVYPHRSLASHVLGFTGVDNQGLAGLERVYNHELSGSPGAVQFTANARGEPLPGGEDRFRPPKDGWDFISTIDTTIQLIVERALSQTMAEYSPDSAWVLVMDPRDGAILAMGSRPAFDPGAYQKHDSSILFRNLPIWKMYEPGSTFKIATLAAALEENKVSLDDHFFDPGAVHVGGARLRCWKAGGHGEQTFLEVVENSCNPGFVELGQRLGKDLLFSYVRRLGFGKKTGIDLPGEASGILFQLARVGPVELATTSFGQGVSVTPLQQATAVSSIINGGLKIVPHMGRFWYDPQTRRYHAIQTSGNSERLITEATSQKVRMALESVVARGTGRRAFLDGYRVGGKTGTAQKVGPDGRYLTNNHIVSFLGFAPADQPRLIVYVAVDNPKGIQFGGVVAAPIAGRILGDSLRYLQVPPREEQILPEDMPLVASYQTVPNVMDMPIDKLKLSLFSFHLDVIGEGDTVINQLPKPGLRVKKGTSLRVYLGYVNQKAPESGT